MIAGATFAGAIVKFLAPLAESLADPEVTEILINGPTEIFIERGGRLSRVSEARLGAADLNGLLRVVSQYSGRPFDENNPILEANLPDGARLTAVGAPLAAVPHLAIRRPPKALPSLEDFVRRRSLTLENFGLLSDIVRERRNVLVAGGTGTGKTSLLRALAGAVDAEERICVLEDARELALGTPHAISFETRRAHGASPEVTMRELVRTALRMRPDRLILGEIRGEEAMDLILAMTSGHAGCLSTIHASSPLDALRRLETLALLGGVRLPLEALREQIAAAISVVVQVARSADGTRKVAQIVGVAGLSGGTYQLVDLARTSQNVVWEAR